MQLPPLLERNNTLFPFPVAAKVHLASLCLSVLMIGMRWICLGLLENAASEVNVLKKLKQRERCFSRLLGNLD